MVMRDVEFMNLRTENQWLEQSLESHKSILRSSVEERERAQKMAENQQRDDEHQKDGQIIKALNKECERTKDLVYRVESERDQAERALRQQYQEFQKLQMRLEETEKNRRNHLWETEKLYREFRKAQKDPMNTPPPQKAAAAGGGMAESTVIDTSTRENIWRLAPTQNRTTNLHLDGTELLGSGAGSMSLDNSGQRVGKEDEVSENSTRGKTVTNSLSGATSANKSGSPRMGRSRSVAQPKRHFSAPKQALELWATLKAWNGPSAHRRG
ncbi:hypothetical protein DHEL01_v206575 [Diaporthe helianthi]|uniref:Uncharacterized protein n=1 Tax=Diaporthe helianthi TaxID=158607 RepID=A0A2P5HXQ6_DIAHE|nr:hypothetical protein DHEL01_v206575 [Diaporthe helianthi]